jgi:decaprenyl-phosphate phosphoribosyltransferase
MLPYLKLIKFRYHITFLTVIFGAIYFAPGITLELWKSLFLLYLSFNILLYGGLYTLNDLADAQSDRKHPYKCRRPIASKAVSPGSALGYAVVLIAAGVFSAAAIWGLRFVILFLMFLAINGIYSFGMRNIPYLELGVNSLTYPLRFMTGVALTGRETPAGHCLAIFFLAVGVVALRRQEEMESFGRETRRAMLRYSQHQLLALEYICLAAILTLFILDALKSKGFYITLIPAYIAIVFGTRRFAAAKGFLRALWNR